MGRGLHPWHRGRCPQAAPSPVIAGPEGGGTGAAQDPADNRRPQAAFCKRCPTGGLLGHGGGYSSARGPPHVRGSAPSLGRGEETQGLQCTGGNGTTGRAPRAPVPPMPPSPRHPLCPQLRLVALNVPLSGDMSGIRGADLQCYRQSQEARLYGTFRAFLSAPTQDLASIVKRTDRALPVVNLKGQLLARSWSSLFEGPAGAAPRGPIYSFNGRNVLTDALWLAWHGSTARGSQARRRDCQGWRSSGPGEGLAAPLGEGKLLAGQRHNCSEELVVLCVEVAFPYRHMW
uniref:Collagenase NC10/endostatin domain-containing protein n=1 Tax=Anser cygnoides TaxID=8845 RepID=A0A8B9DUQ8_ANSCY